MGSFLLWFFVMCFAVFRATYAVPNDNSGLLFATGLPVVRSPAVFCRKGDSHLRPRTRCRHFAVPSYYWLILLLAGDVETNPGPTRYPCTVCSKAVMSRQKVVKCTRCERWTDASYGGISNTEYTNLRHQALCIEMTHHSSTTTWQSSSSNLCCLGWLQQRVGGRQLGQYHGSTS